MRLLQTFYISPPNIPRRIWNMPNPNSGRKDTSSPKEVWGLTTSRMPRHMRLMVEILRLGLLRDLSQVNNH